MAKWETELTNLQSNYNRKVSTSKKVGISFARKIEADIATSNPDRYIVNGVKSWAFPNKHIAFLQKKCNGTLPPRHSEVNLLKVAVEEHELKSQRLRAKKRFVNPKKPILEDEYAVRFPRHSTSTARACSSSSFPGSSLLSAEEGSDFWMAVPWHSPSTASSTSTFSGSPFLSAEDESALRMVVSRHSPSTASSSSPFSGPPFLSAEEESDFRMAVHLQAELNNQTLCGDQQPIV